jgi:hypothetical protein
MTRGPFFIDLEASGIAPDSYPVEVGVVGPVWRYSSLIKPVHYWTYWDYDAQDMHGISRELLLSVGADPDDVAQKLNEKLDGELILADSPLDRFWLEVLYEASSFEPSFEISNLYSYLSAGDAGLFRKHLQVAKAHRALPDALANQSAYFAMMKAKAN